MPEESPPLFCDRCLVELTPGRGEYYLVRIEAVADPSPPVIEAEDLLGDIDSEIRRVLDRLRDTTEREAMDQVRRVVVLHLCNRCYSDWIEDPARSV